ncbi:MAG TPA: hypothetical protein VK436_16215 [Methanocella sp.]|nr:hypothetical protein [Methanocella sp.]
MIVRILVGAVVGAIAGFIIGWIVELFSGFNAALLHGLNVLTGISGVRTSALLAAIGFILGILGGILHGVASSRRYHRV